VKHDPSIKDLVFDLGGVVLDLSIDKSMQQFAALFGLDKKKANEIYTPTPGFEI